jgi:hypothetical protein
MPGCRQGHEAPRFLLQASWVWVNWPPWQRKQGRVGWVLAAVVAKAVALNTKMVWLRANELNKPQANKTRIVFMLALFITYDWHYIVGDYT